LTDEKARDNFLKYGNPDGRTGAYQVGIAMPNILLDKEIAVPFLIGAFSFLLIGVPGFLWFNYFETTNKDEGGIILIANKKMFGSEVNENLLFKHIPFILTKTIEFQ
jgi:preprotein translocase subunit Sec63